MTPRDKRCHFRVTGRGPFPFDMLRYDACWPRRQDDVSMVERTFRRGYNETQTIWMASAFRPPTEARWASFGWTVSEVAAY